MREHPDHITLRNPSFFFGPIKKSAHHAINHSKPFFCYKFCTLALKKHSKRSYILTSELQKISHFSSSP